MKIWNYIFAVLFFISCNGNKELKKMSFPDLNQSLINLENLPNSKATVFYFLAPECPVSQNYTKNINEIQLEFEKEGVQFYAVFSGIVYSTSEIAKYIDEYNLNLSILIDKEYKLAKYFDAEITPEVFVVSPTESVWYRGRISNWIEDLGVKRTVVTEFYLRDVLNQIVKGEIPNIENTKAVGCILE